MLFSSSSLSAIRVVSSAYLRLLIFLPAVWIPACASSSPAFLTMYSVYKLNKQGDNIQPWHTPFPIWKRSSYFLVVPCPVLTLASWPAYRFLKSQVRWSGIPISFRIHSMWSLPGSGIKPVSPVLAGEFFTTEPPRKPCKAVFQAAAWLHLENKDQRSIFLLS